MNINQVKRKHILQMVSWCIDTFGLSEYHDGPPKLLVHYRQHNNYGEYDNDLNKIHIYLPNHKSILELCDTVIHEFTHYRQNLIWYYDYNKQATLYNPNPYEIEAMTTAKAHKKNLKKFINSTYIKKL